MAKMSGGNRGGILQESGLSYKSIKGVESIIRKQTTEYAAVFNSSGDMVVFRQGDNDQVNFTAEELSKMANAVVTHNHPFGNAGITKIGSSFSKEDLSLAVYTNAKEIRAVSNNYTFSMKRPKKGWGVSYKDAKKELNNIQKDVSKRLNHYRDNYKGRRSVANSRANILEPHLISKEAAKLFGWKYTKTIR